MTSLQTARLRLRPLSADDFEAVHTLGSDERVMAPLGGVRSAEQARTWIEREVATFTAHGYCRNLVTRDGEVVGLVGLSRTSFDAGVVPGIEIAWQLAPAHWGKGFATEAARCVIEHAFTTHRLREVIAVTSQLNDRSRRVMERLGMQAAPSETFEHPHIAEGNPLRTHIVYRALNPNQKSPSG